MSARSNDEPAPGESWQAGAPVLPSLEAAAKRPLEVLDDDELIELSLKPSLWLIVLSSWRVLAVAALLAGVAWGLGNRGDTSAGALFYIVLAATGVLRVAWAALAWASRHYLLTNRRVMRCDGVMQGEVDACPLRRVRQVRVVQDVRPRGLGLATIRIISDHDDARTIDWTHLAQVDEVFPIIARAVKRSRDGQ